MRFTLAVILMLSVGLIFRGNTIVGLQRVDKQDIPLFLLGGLLQPFLYFIFETYTYQSFASPTIAEAMLSTQPIMAPIMAWLLLREQVTKYNIIGILISTAGMLLLLLTGGEQFAIGNHWGILLAIITVSCSVGYSVILRRIPERYSPLTIVFYVQTISLASTMAHTKSLNVISSLSEILLYLHISNANPNLTTANATNASLQKTKAQ